MEATRRFPVGAEVLPEQGVHFRVWSPRDRPTLVLESDKPARAVALAAENGAGVGYYSALVPGVGHGVRYGFRFVDSAKVYPDPASRFQPDGPHGLSQVIDASRFRWTDGGWRGVGVEGQVIYEMHVGTFTREGTFAAALAQLPELARLGVTVLEVMPVADFPGRFGWGYDGVDLFAPTRLYGEPDDFRRFVDRAHGLGLGVILDVVYNHIGPDGNYLRQFAADYFTDRYKNEWGEALNFDGPRSGPVREFFIANAGYWVDEFHLDGLRLDATQQICDASPEHILAAIGRRVRQAAGDRATLIVAENEEQHTKLVRPSEQGGYGLDALWNDDLHHSAWVALTGHNEAYCSDYLGSPQEFVAAAKWGYLYQGQYYAWQKQRRGTPALDLAPSRFVSYLENHDQLANSGRGFRGHQLGSPGRHKALTAFILLAPGTPMLFQGQEFAASAPFLFFADHEPDLARKVRKGRKKFLAQFPSLALPEMQALLDDPADPRTFAKCKLDWSERERHGEIYALHRDLLALRRDDAVFRGRRRRGLDGAVLAPQAFALRFFAADGMDRLLVVNLGRDLRLIPCPEPLLAPCVDCRWRLAWSSEDIRYGGRGTPPVDADDGWHIPGEAAVVLVPA